MVDSDLAKKFGWKIGDRIVLQGTIWDANLELTIRGMYKAPQPTQSVYFDRKYFEESVPIMKDQSGTFGILADSPGNVPKVAAAVDDMFHNSPQQTKTESEKAFGLDFVAMLGNVKAFILEYLRRSGVCDFAGCGEHDGDVHPRTHARSGRAEDAGIHAQDGAGAVCGRGRGGCNRSAG